MAELKKCWVVRNVSKAEIQDAAETGERLTADDLVYETTAEGLVSLIIGTESQPGRWRVEKTKIHTDLASAKADAEKRLAKIYKNASSYDRRSA